jgi:Co/Zn/Cd efflux system component
MHETTFAVPRMDCPSEERLIRMALQPEQGVLELRFDLAGRRLVVVHAHGHAGILARLEPLGLGATFVETRAVETVHGAQGDVVPTVAPADAVSERAVLRKLLAVNGLMFVVELAVGLRAESTGVLADAVDMFADAAVYGVALHGAGKGAAGERRAARLSGIVQLVLALGVATEVVRRAFGGSEPLGGLMLGVSVLALAANVLCLALVSRHRTGGVHMKASWIFTANDVLANVGVIVAGGLVAWTGSALPDLVIGGILAVAVGAGAVRILRLAGG